MKHQSIALSKLTASKSNVRTTYSDEGIKEMKASIQAHGLMQNLVVKKAGEKFEVVSGNRRLVALQELLKDKLFTGETLIQCAVLENESAEELSLAENTVREEMHPADEYEAFSALAKTLTAEKIALRFGVTKKHVEQRLLLGRVAPEIMKAFRDGKLELESLMAFTICADQKRQLAVYKGLSSWEKNNSRSIRAKFSEKMESASSSVAMFVGEAAYVKAGGKVLGDLFSESKYFEDKALVDKLAKAKIQAAVDKYKAEGWGFVEFSMTYDYSFKSKFDEIDKAPKKAELPNCGIYIELSNGKLEVSMLRKRGGKKGESSLAAAKKKDAGGISEALRIDLANYRMEIAQLNISNNHQLAYDLMAYHLATALDAGRYAYGGYSTMSFDVQSPNATVAADKTKASVMMKEQSKKLDNSWRSHKTEQEKFNAFVKLPNATKAAFVAHAFAMSIRPQYTGKPGKSLVDLAFDRIDCVPAMFWRPTKENYLGRITTEMLNAIGKELFGKDWKNQNGKSGLVKYLHDIFADPKKAAKGSLELQNRIEQWLPSGFAFTLLGDAPSKKAA